MFSSMILALGFFLTAACGKEDGLMTEDPDSLTIVEFHLDFTALGGKGTVVVEANKPVGASSNQDWVSSIGIEGNDITFDVGMNNTISDRTATITITAGEATESLKVIQGVAELEVSTSDINFTEQGGRRAIAVKTNLTEPYQVIIDDNWLSYEIKNDSLILIVESTPIGVIKRETKVHLTYFYGREKEITVKQINFTGTYKVQCTDHDNEGYFDREFTNISLKIDEKNDEIYILKGKFPRNEFSISCIYKDEKLIINAGQYVGEGGAPFSSSSYLFVVNRSIDGSVIIYSNKPEASYVAPLVIGEDNIVNFLFTDGNTWSSPVNGIAVKNTEKYLNHFFDMKLVLDPNPIPDGGGGEGGGDGGFMPYER
ncbi:hypothetical protein EZS27_015471 [termite gut metagenome]|uniref:BACON domain-containing protein n=1 Tax=termite gut metagenome TaxID=433724 RepID=A0A5J4RS90_9ZZZZ